MPQDALTGPGIPHQARAFNTLMHGEVSFRLHFDLILTSFDRFDPILTRVYIDF